MEASGFLRVARALDATIAGALRREVISELSKQPWWWSTPLRAMFATEKDARPSSASSASSSLFQEANIRSSFRRRLLVLPVDDPAHPERSTPLGALCREAIRAVVSAHAERCASPDGRPLLSPDAALVELTAVVALPGAFAQDPHADIVDEDEDEDAEEDAVEDTDADAEHSRRQKDARDATRVVAASSFDGGEKTGASRGPSSHLVSKPLERFEPSESSSDIHGVDDPFDGKRPSRLPALLTSWVSLQPVTLAGGPTVIFPGTHARGAGLARMAPKAVRAYRGRDLSEEDELFIQLMHGDAVDAANEGYAVAALDLTEAEREEGEKKSRERKRRERWWRRLRADAEGGARGADAARDAARPPGLDDRFDDRLDDCAARASPTGAPGGSPASDSPSNSPSRASPRRDENSPPVSMTNAFAGDLVVMDTKVWHFGSANRSFVPRVLLNVTFQEPSARRPDVSTVAEDAGDARARDAGPKKKKRDDVLRREGWVEDVDEDPRHDPARKTSLPPSRPSMEVRRIDGFTYHVHESVLGKYAVRDFMPGGAMY